MVSVHRVLLTSEKKPFVLSPETVARGGAVGVIGPPVGAGEMAGSIKSIS